MAIQHTSWYKLPIFFVTFSPLLSLFFISFARHLAQYASYMANRSLYHNYQSLDNSLAHFHRPNAMTVIFTMADITDTIYTAHTPSANMRPAPSRLATQVTQSKQQTFFQKHCPTDQRPSAPPRSRRSTQSGRHLHTHSHPCLPYEESVLDPVADTFRIVAGSGQLVDVLVDPKHRYLHVRDTRTHDDPTRRATRIYVTKCSLPVGSFAHHQEQLTVGTHQLYVMYGQIRPIKAETVVRGSEKMVARE